MKCGRNKNNRMLQIVNVNLRAQKVDRKICQPGDIYNQALGNAE